MTWEQIFGVTNGLAVAGWLALAALPRRKGVLDAVLYLAIGLLCAIYLALFFSLLGGFVDPVREGSVSAPTFDYSVAGLQAMFASQGTIVVGWTHYLAFDLFVGVWIARDADARQAARWIQLPFLFATLMAGPIGLLGWLIARRFYSARSMAGVSA